MVPFALHFVCQSCQLPVTFGVLRPEIKELSTRYHSFERLSPPEAVPEEAPAETTKRDPSSSPDLPLSTVSHSRQNSLHQLPTSATTDEPEPMALDTTEPIPPPPAPVTEPEPVQVSEPPKEPEPLAAVPPTEPKPAPVATIEPEAAPAVATVAENTSAPPSEPDLMASLDRHLEKDNEEIAGS